MNSWSKYNFNTAICVFKYVALFIRGRKTSYKIIIRAARKKNCHEERERAEEEEEEEDG